MKNIKILVFITLVLLLLLCLFLFLPRSTNKPTQTPVSTNRPLQTPDSTSKPPQTPIEPDDVATGPLRLPFELKFTAFTFDPDGDDISYQFDWGDGSMSEWSDFIPSGRRITEFHSYKKEGYFKIKVRAKDITGLLSEWSEPHNIAIYP